MLRFFHGKPVTIRITVVTVFFLMGLSIAGLILGLQYYFSLKMARASAEKDFYFIAEKVRQRINALDQESEDLCRTMSSVKGMAEPPVPGQPHPELISLTRAMEKRTSIYAIYIGHPNGDFYEVINLENGEDTKKKFNASTLDRWLVIKILARQGHVTKTLEFLGSDHTLLATRHETTDYDPRKRPWFKNAVNSNQVERTGPYMFSHLKAPGLTYAKKMDQGRILGVDISLDGLSRFITLAKKDLLPSSHAVLFDPGGEILAHGQPEGKTDPFPTQNLIAKLPGVTDKPPMVKTLTSKNIPYLAASMAINPEDRETAFIGMAVERNRVLKPYLDKIKISILISLGFLLAFTPVIWFTASIIVTPIKALARESEKVKKRLYDQVTPVKSRIFEISHLSKSMVSMASAIQEHERAQEKLMDSFIKLIALTIDEKSPYTGKHCERVPQLAMMIAKKVSSSNAPEFSGFKLTTKDEWREFETAAWLHDCGKIVTPEHIVDKGSKLELIYNRIHEVRMRFEVLIRDARIEYFQALAKGEEDPLHLKKELAAKEEKIKLDFAFVAQCNIGGEFMAEEKIKKLKTIAAKTWVRHLDDRLGLSQPELLRYPKKPGQLPCREQILKDMDEHIIPRDLNRHSDDHKFGFKMEVPELEQNQGEVYNLSIARGTLTAEDRYRIQEHMTTTIRMLELLPFPKELARIPEYAGAHHETLTGTGYPKKLIKDQLSIPARILAIADIFEALTAADRPYKKGKTLNQAIKIMNSMKDKGHIDPDLFNFFIEQNIYMEYADAFINPVQIDRVDTLPHLTREGHPG